MPLPPPNSTLFPYTTLFRSPPRRAAIRYGARRAADADPPGQGRDPARPEARAAGRAGSDGKSTRLNFSHVEISYAVFCSEKKISHRLLGKVQGCRRCVCMGV